MKYRPIYTWLIILSITYGMLLGLGTWRARGIDPAQPLKVHFATEQPLEIVTYTVSQMVAEDLPPQPDEQWMEEIGIPTPKGAGVHMGQHSSRIWMVGNTRENHEKLRAWLNQNYGRKHWGFTTQRTYSLSFELGERQFGLEEMRHLRPHPHPPSPAVHFARDRYTTLVYGFNNNARMVYDWDNRLAVTSQQTLFHGAAWLILLLLVFGPGLLLYFLRRPLRRIIASLRLRQTKAASSSAAP